MTGIQITIESLEADKAAEDLLNINGLEGSWEEVISDEGLHKEGILVTIATIVGIVGGTAALAEQIRKWYQEYKNSQSDKYFNVVIVTANGRVVLENATIKEISQALEVLNK